MKTIEQQTIVEIQLTTSIIMVDISGKRMLIKPINKTELETNRIHQMLKVSPPPLNELNLENKVDNDKIIVDMIIMISIPH